MATDWKFISKCEGGRSLKGYVPASETSKSGVTFGTGVDLGQRSEAEIDALDIPPALKAKQKPYARNIKASAVGALAQHQLSVTDAEAEALDKAVKGPIVTRLTAAYDPAAVAAGSALTFAALPAGAQTVIASVAFQYDTDLARRTPNFWKAATRHDWPAVIKELENFGDRYPTRRKAEAKLVKDIGG